MRAHFSIPSAVHCKAVHQQASLQVNVIRCHHLHRHHKLLQKKVEVNDGSKALVSRDA